MKKKTTLTMLAILTSVFLMLIYLFVRILTFTIAESFWFEKIIATVLLTAEIFILIHGIGYAFEIYKVVAKEGIEGPEERPFELKTHPNVLIIIPSYHEPLSLLEDTIISSYNLSYKNKHIVLLDDTKYEEIEDKNYRKNIEELCKRRKIGLFRRKWRGAKAGIINDYLDYVHGRIKKHFFYFEYSEKKSFKNPKYLVVFDADQKAFVDFIEKLVFLMESDPKLAFVQTPQYYTNFKNKVAKAAMLQQAVFYEFIGEGKGLSEAMISCGTNGILRMKALEEVGGFEENTVTEDFATSFKMQLNNWKTLYYNKVKVFGIGPESLKSYFKQQYRWAFGTISLLKKWFKEFFKNPRRMSAAAWWEYFLSCSYYLTGFVFFIFMICPIIFLLFNVPSYFLDMKVYSAFFIPYFVVSIFVYYGTLRQRGYSVRELMYGQGLLFDTFYIYMKASIAALLNKKKKFELTAKTKEGALPIYLLWPQLFMASLSFIAAIYGINRLYFENVFLVPISVNVFWCFYNCFVLNFILYFNDSLGNR